MKKSTARVNISIHLFAAAHAVTAVVSRLAGFPDDMVLTILTILMVIMVSRTCGFPLDISATIALLCCFAGFYLGIKGAELISSVWSGRLAGYSNVITTFAVTEILGWMTYFIIRKRKVGS